jgi:hypothetical protein
MATKLGELQRQGACANHLVGFKVVDPKFSEIPAVSPTSEDYVSIFGFDCYTGCSKMGRVVYRGKK